MQPYRTADWAKYRAEVIRMDGGACLTCGRGPADGAVLQVHHKRYLPGHKPWEYPFELCETICAGCHAAHHGLIPPKFGWEHVAWDDLEDLAGTCECCGTSIRYVFMIQHPKWRAMEVGETCCDNLTSDQVASGFMESKRRYAHRLKTFIGSSRWTIHPGNIHQLRQKRHTIQVVPQANSWQLRIDWNDGKQRFGSVNEAKAKAFEVIESGSLETYFAKRAAARARSRI